MYEIDSCHLRWYIGYMSDLLKKGAQKPLEMEDLHDIPHVMLFKSLLVRCVCMLSLAFMRTFANLHADLNKFCRVVLMYCELSLLRNIMCEGE